MQVGRMPKYLLNWTSDRSEKRGKAHEETATGHGIGYGKNGDKRLETEVTRKRWAEKNCEDFGES